MKKEIVLPPIKETVEDYAAIEREIAQAWKREVYIPLIQIIGEPKSALQNAADDSDNEAVINAIQKGKITFNRGKFKGKFTSRTSRELRDMGAKWNRKESTFDLPSSQLPQEVRNAIDVSTARYLKTAAQLDAKLAAMSPAEIAGSMKLESLFDTTLWKIDKQFNRTIKDITVAPTLTKTASKIIADEYSNNVKLYIKDFTEKQIKTLRKDVQQSVFTGKRYEEMIDDIQKSYKVSYNKAKFLARQETSLMSAKFAETRYKDAGINEYKWCCVVGSPAHPVRPSHKKLEGKTFRWDDPPVTTEPGEPVRRNNPKQDYNCRCYPRPIVKF